MCCDKCHGYLQKISYVTLRISSESGSFITKQFGKQHQNLTIYNLKKINKHSGIGGIVWGFLQLQNGHLVCILLHSPGLLQFISRFVTVTFTHLHFIDIKHCFGIHFSGDNLNVLRTKQVVLTFCSRKKHKLPVRTNVIFLRKLRKNKRRDDRLIRMTYSLG